MTEAERHIITKHRRGEHITPADVCATITSGAELTAYCDALKRQGRLTIEALAAIDARRVRL